MYIGYWTLNKYDYDYYTSVALQDTMTRTYPSQQAALACSMMRLRKVNIRFLG